MKFEELKVSDVIKVKKMIADSPSIVDPKFVIAHILEHIDRYGTTATKIVDEKGTIKGIWCSMESDTSACLSYFYIHDSIRRTMHVYDFFMYNRMLVGEDKPLFIKTKDTAEFTPYVEPFIEAEGIYIFKGLRDTALDKGYLAYLDVKNKKEDKNG